VRTVNASPTDRPEHFAHANTADSFIEVWLAADDPSEERKLLERFGARFRRRIVHVPDPVHAEVSGFSEGGVVFLPGSRQSLKGRIVGAALRVKRLASARGVLEQANLLKGVHEASDRSRLFVPPHIAHGLWIELRETK
jgi:hypothetical protein